MKNSSFRQDLDLEDDYFGRWALSSPLAISMWNPRQRKNSIWIDKDSPSLKSNSRTAKYESKLMFSISTLILKTWTLIYFTSRKTSKILKIAKLKYQNSYFTCLSTGEINQSSCSQYQGRNREHEFWFILGRPRVAFQRRWVFVDPDGVLSLPWISHWNCQRWW